MTGNGREHLIEPRSGRACANLALNDRMEEAEHRFADVLVGQGLRHGTDGYGRLAEGFADDAELFHGIGGRLEGGMFPGTQVQHHGGQELLHGLVATGMHAPEPLVGDPLVGGMLVHDVQRVMILEQHVRRVEDADHGQAPIGELLRLVRRPVLEERARLHAGHRPGSIGRGWFLANLEAPTALVRGAAPAVGRPRDGFRITRFPWRPLCEGVPDG